MKKWFGKINNIKFNCLLSKKSKMSESKAQDILDANNKNRIVPTFDIITDNSPIVDLMIVIPVYNVEQYLEECIKSIITQKTEFSFVAVFVNDGSTDGCAQILNKYKDNPVICIIDQENQGISGARNTALVKNFGQYIMFVDSDDVLCDNAVQTLMRIAKEENADIVEGNYIRFSAGSTDVIEETIAIKNVPYWELSGYAWGKVIRSNWLLSSAFPLNYVYEDTIMSTLVQPRISVAFKTNKIVYKYRINPLGLDTVTNSTKKVLDTFWVTKYCFEESQKKGITWSNEIELLYINQIRLNWIRMAECQEELKEAVFVLTALLFNKYWIDDNTVLTSNHKKLKQSLKKNSYSAFTYVLNVWE